MLATTRLAIREDLDEKMPYKKAIILSAKDAKMWVSRSVGKRSANANDGSSLCYR